MLERDNGARKQEIIQKTQEFLQGEKPNSIKLYAFSDCVQARLLYYERQGQAERKNDLLEKHFLNEHSLSLHPDNPQALENALASRKNLAEAEDAFSFSQVSYAISLQTQGNHVIEFGKPYTDAYEEVRRLFEKLSTEVRDPFSAVSGMKGILEEHIEKQSPQQNRPSQ